MDTPIGLWNELASRGRNDAVLMSFSDAVRAYLEKRDALLTPEGIVLHGQLSESRRTGSHGRSDLSGWQRSDADKSLFFGRLHSPYLARLDG